MFNYLAEYCLNDDEITDKCVFMIPVLANCVLFKHIKCNHHLFNVEECMCVLCSMWMVELATRNAPLK
jgi:hypothetical protein